MAREGLNKVILIGNLGQDPELNYTQSGQAQLKMSLATSESYVDKSGNRQEKTEWHRVVLWGKRAEALGKFLTKGRSLCVEGSIEYREWEKDGVKKYMTQIRARNVVLLGGSDGNGQRREAGRSDFGGGNPSQYYDAQDSFGDDEIPF